MMSWIGLHKFTYVVFGITQKPLYITSLNLVKQYVTNKGIFLNLLCNLKSDWSLVPDSFCFWWFYPLKGTRFKRNNKINFFKAFWWSSLLFLKEFLACSGCFGLFAKIKKGSEISVWCTFSVQFFHKNVPFIILYQWTKFQCHTFFLFQDDKMCC